MRRVQIRVVIVVVLLHAIVLASLALAQEGNSPKDKVSIQASEILVEGKRVESTGEYSVQQTTTGTKTEAPIQEVPQTINVVTKDLLQDQGATTVEDVWRNVSGSHTALGPGGGGNLTLRGFNMSGWGAPFSYPLYFNGLRGQPYGGFSSPRLYNVEQVEVLKGPASVLYGSADPGGVINLVSRKPQQEQSSEWDAAYGSFDLYRIHNHSTGPMTDDPELLYLLDVGYENAGSFRDNVETENIQITPGFSWIPNNACRIDFEFGYIHDRRDGQSDRGIPAVNGLYFVLPDSFNSNEPWDYTQTAAYYGEAHLRLDMTDSLSLYSGIRAFTSKNEQHFHFPGTLDTRTWMLPRTFSESWDDQDGIANDTHILWKAGGDGIENQVLFGIETSCGSDDRRTQSASAGVSSLYIWDPVYDADSAGYVFGAPSRLNSEMLRCGGYLHDELTLQRRLHLLAGCRYDRYETEQIDPTGATPAYEDDGDSPTFNGGALYDLVKESKASLNDLSVYASYGECYQPQSQPRYAPGTPAAVRSETFDPLTGWQVESGVKGAWLENKLTTTLALFHIAQKNILTVDPTDPTGYTYDTIGAQESDGLEVEVAGRLTKAWSVSANYAYTDATITEDSRPANVGKRLPNVAKNQAGLWSRCDIGGTGFAVMGGVTYVGEREPFTGFAGDPYPAYTTVDVGASYVFKRVTLGAGLNNVFDEDIALGGRGAYGYMPGAPRNFLLTAKVTL